MYYHTLLYLVYLNIHYFYAQHNLSMKIFCQSMYCLRWWLHFFLMGWISPENKEFHLCEVNPQTKWMTIKWKNVPLKVITFHFLLWRKYWVYQMIWIEYLLFSEIIHFMLFLMLIDYLEMINNYVYHHFAQKSNILFNII